MEFCGRKVVVFMQMRRLRKIFRNGKWRRSDASFSRENPVDFGHS
jgi:hypothetical protein